MNRFTLCALFMALGLVAGSGLFAESALAQQGAAGPEWRSYGGDTGSTKYSPLDQTDGDHVERLQLAWPRTSRDAPVLSCHDL